MANTRLVVLLPALRATLVTDDDTKAEMVSMGSMGAPGASSGAEQPYWVNCQR